MKRRIGTVGDLRAALEGLPDEASVLAQVVATNGDAWTVFLETANGDDCGFKWTVQPLVVRASHRELTALIDPKEGR